MISAPVTPSPAATGLEDRHQPLPGEHWQSGRTLALPCAVAVDASRATLLRAGPVDAEVEGFVRPMLRLRPGGRIDLADGILGVSGSEWITGTDHLDFPGELTYTRVPKGQPVVTIARVWDGATNDSWAGDDLAAAEVRLSDAVPVRWEEHGWAGTDVAQGAWFGSASRARLEATGYDPLFQPDDKGRSVVDVIAWWDVPCYTLDVAPREPGQVHDVVIVDTGGDGTYRQYIGYDEGGQPASAVLLGMVPWAALQLPGTAPR